MSQDRIKLYESLKASFLHIDNHEKAYSARFGLNIPRFYVLVHVGFNPGMNYIDLSDRLLCTKSNTTRIMQGMLRDDLITRKNDPKDGRSFKLYLTDKGMEVLDRVYPGFVNRVNQLMSPFSDDEIDKYLKVLQHIESTLSPNPSVNLINTQVLGLDIQELRVKDE